MYEYQRYNQYSYPQYQQPQQIQQQFPQQIMRNKPDFVEEWLILLRKSQRMTFP